MKNYIAQQIKIYVHVQEEPSIEQLKAVKEDIKTSGSWRSSCAAIAKAIVNEKVDDLNEKCEITEALITLSQE